MPRLASLLSPLLLLAAVGCNDLGERAEGGSCPDWPCSDATPEGLEFSGPVFASALFGNQGVKITAVGGAQYVELIDHATGRALPAGYDAYAVGDALAVTGSLRNVVTLEGRAPGRATLRVDDDSGLLDLLGVEADAIAEVGLRPHPMRISREDPSRPWLAWTGAEAELLIELRAADGTELVDEDLEVVSSDGATVEETAWDSRAVQVGAAGIAVTVRAGDLAAPLPFAAAAASQLDAVRGRVVTGGPATAGGVASVCFEASSGGTDVVFVPWTFALGGGEQLPNLFGGDNCVAAHRDTAGFVDVTGTAPGGLTATVRVEFVAPTSARRLRSAAPVPAGPSLGERAGG